MNRVLLDTDILSDFLRGHNGNVIRRAQAYMGEHGRLTLSAVTVFEVVRLAPFGLRIENWRDPI
jgi:predicted nucleic acid-binding protein